MTLQPPYVWLVIGALIIMTILVIVFIAMWYNWKNKCKVSSTGNDKLYTCDFS